MSPNLRLDSVVDFLMTATFWGCRFHVYFWSFFSYLRFGLVSFFSYFPLHLGAMLSAPVLLISYPRNYRQYV